MKAKDLRHGKTIRDEVIAQSATAINAMKSFEISASESEDHCRTDG